MAMPQSLAQRQSGGAISEYSGLAGDARIPANSMVGEIPVYAQYYDIDVPSIGGYAQREFCAWFNVSGYTYCLLTLDCTQEEFLDIVLAIINHYGAYPSQE